MLTIFVCFSAILFCWLCYRTNFWGLRRVSKRQRLRETLELIVWEYRQVIDDLAVYEGMHRRGEISCGQYKVREFGALTMLQSLKNQADIYRRMLAELEGGTPDYIKGQPPVFNDECGCRSSGLEDVDRQLSFKLRRIMNPGKN